jgi:hypothetical protein
MRLSNKARTGGLVGGLLCVAVLVGDLVGRFMVGVGLGVVVTLTIGIRVPGLPIRVGVEGLEQNPKRMSY